MDKDYQANTPEDWHDLTLQLRDKTIGQVADLAQMQADVQKWYAMKPGKSSQELELDECPALLRVMQIIRLLRESLLEFEQELQGS